MNKYKLRVNTKTRILNSCRKIFTLPPFENILVKFSKGKSPDSFAGKLIPPCYLYPRSSIRTVVRNGFKFELDIHEAVDHFIYFGFKESAREALYSLVKQGMVVLDVGANIGETSIMFSNLVKSEGKVYCFEPDDLNFKKLSRNISINGIKNIEPFQIGLGNENKKAKLFNVRESNSGMKRVLNDASGNFDFTEINIRTLDALGEERKINHIDLIKIDVEGFEFNVLTGASETLKRYKPILFIELIDNNLREQGADSAGLINFLSSLGYSVTHSESGRKLTSAMNFSGCHYDIIARHS
ncbi:MAG: FkbM family methyltransferase [Bacteroidia bacterium]